MHLVIYLQNLLVWMMYSSLQNIRGDLLSCKACNNVSCTVATVLRNYVHFHRVNDVCCVYFCHACVITIKAWRIRNQRLCLLTLDTPLQLNCADVTESISQSTSNDSADTWRFSSSSVEFTRVSISDTRTPVLFYDWRIVDRTKSGAVQYE